MYAKIGKSNPKLQEIYEVFDTIRFYLCTFCFVDGGFKSAIAETVWQKYSCSCGIYVFRKFGFGERTQYESYCIL